MTHIIAEGKTGDMSKNRKKAQNDKQTPHSWPTIAFSQQRTPFSKRLKMSICQTCRIWKFHKHAEKRKPFISRCSCILRCFKHVHFSFHHRTSGQYSDPDCSWTILANFFYKTQNFLLHSLQVVLIRFLTKMSQLPCSEYRFVLFILRSLTMFSLSRVVRC